MVTRTRNHTTATNKPAAVKAAGAAAAKARTAERTQAAPKTPGAGSTPMERQRLIAEAAYYIAERRGFSPGNELEDWLQAEREVDLRTGGSMH